jgi:GNAT superfamily N-acetyltransferase
VSLSAEHNLPPGYGLRPLGKTDLPALYRLNQAVAAALPDPGAFRLFGGAESFFAAHFDVRGSSIGIFDGEALCAYGALTRPRADDVDNYAGDLGWPPERAGTVALLSAAMVAPMRRGLGLHSALIRARLMLAAELGHVEALARAAPLNARSRRNLLAAGFAIVWLGVQAEGSLRHIYWRPLTDDVARTQCPTTWVAAADFAAQQALLAGGLLGVARRAPDEAIGFAPRAAYK